MLKENKVSDLRLMYDLFSLEPVTLEFILTALDGLVRSTGTAIVEDAKLSPQTFVQRFVETRAKFQVFVAHGFANDRAFERRLTEAIKFALNLDVRAGTRCYILL
jgi:hypothetical protein